MSFDLEKAIREVLSDGKETPCIFDRLMEKFENYSDRPASTYIEIRQRDNKQNKGFAWEKFCQWYLLNVKKYHSVWLWKEIPQDVKEKCNLTMKTDNGIDIVAQKYENGNYSAVQCKYKKRQIAKGRKTVKVSWRTLSTFIGLCERSHDWVEHIVMTNCNGVGKWEIPRTSKDKTIAYGTFKNLSRTDCNANATILLNDPLNTKIPKTQEELRAARLAFYK